jgi:hypothetical protein
MTRGASSKLPPILAPPPVKPNGPLMRGAMAQKIAPVSAKAATTGQRSTIRQVVTTAMQNVATTSVRSGGHEIRLFNRLTA